jgi:UDP-N-acetylglucosamine 2-epimerase (non-hydrolysing)
MTQKKLIYLIAAARPNFMKIAPLYHALKKQGWAETVIVHTGQHYYINMSGTFFRDLRLPEPHIHLGVGSGTHAEQTGRVMIAIERVLAKKLPDLMVVVGDVNSTMAASVTAVKLGIKVAHLEAGLRSFDRTMPEEINRIVTDAVSDLLWTPSSDGDENLLSEGIPPEKIHRVGNIMIDSLEMFRGSIEQKKLFASLGYEPGGYGVVTLHRPANVDMSDVLKKLCYSLADIAEKIPLVFPVHPRTMKNLEAYGYLSILNDSSNLRLMEPLSYVPFMNLVFNCRLVITDSGGIQEETTYLGIPCLTLRDNTERPITITEGTNRLCNVNNLMKHAKDIINGKHCQGFVPELWDGRTAERMVQSIEEFLEVN